MLMNFAALLLGFIVLVYCADRFVTGTAAIARNFGVSPLIIGLTIVGFGTSVPEMLVSGLAAWEGKTGLAVGNALGSNIANIGLILGCSALVAPITMHSGLLRRELPVLLGTSVVCYLLGLRGGLERVDGMLMLAMLALFVFWLIRSALQNRNSDVFGQELEQEIPSNISTGRAVFWSVVGLAGLLGSSRLLVWAAVNIAEFFAVSDLIIGLTIIAVGTSLPELAASIASVLKKEEDLAIGNIIGSNMYNLLAVYSLPGLIAPGPLEPGVVQRDFPVMLGFTAALFFMGYGFSRSGRINRLEGLGMVLAFGAYQLLVYRVALSG
ncbi:MAG: calcium/sodium antiporter [Pseudomonadota bacterium]